MIREWTHAVANTGLHYREADFGDSALDEFECGDEPHAIEMRDFFQARGWSGKALNFPRPSRCLQFGTLDAIVGYVAFVIQERPYPTFKGKKKRDYLLIAQMAIVTGFQGIRDPDGTATYAREIFDELKRIAQQEKCAGLYLNVRKENGKARACYEKAGFKADGEYLSPHMPGAEMIRYRLEI